VGTLREVSSSSSIALSLIELEPAVETLPRRAPNGKAVVCTGDVPDRPRAAETDIRRPVVAPVVEIALGKGEVGVVPSAMLLGLPPKIDEKVCCVKDPRRFRIAPSVGLLSWLDIMVAFGLFGEVRVWGCGVGMQS
jgi:hypothetical protein